MGTVSPSTVRRWLAGDAIRPWRYRSWIFPRDPDFAAKAGRVLDLYQRIWDGRELAGDEYVISADEKSSSCRRCPAAIPACRQRLAGRAGWSLSTSEAAPSPTSALTTCTMPG